MKVIEYYEDENTYYFVSELYSGGGLNLRLSQEKLLHENEAAEIMKQILSAIFYCHRNHIAHR